MQSAQPGQRRLRAGAIVGVGVVMLVASLLTSCSSGEGDRTVITFFQFKSEAQSYFQDLAKQFEKANPKVRIVVDNPADPERRCGPGWSRTTHPMS